MWVAGTSEQRLVVFDSLPQCLVHLHPIRLGLQNLLLDDLPRIHSTETSETRQAFKYIARGASTRRGHATSSRKYPMSAVSVPRNSSALEIIHQNLCCSFALILRRYQPQSHLQYARLLLQQGYNRCREPTRLSICALTTRFAIAGRFCTAR